MITMKRIYDLFVSGGKDSVVAATIAYEEAKQQSIPARVIFINELKAFEIPENLLPHKPLDYIREFSRWLGVELIVLEPNFNYWEGVNRWGYPLVHFNRWCMYFLKQEPLRKLIAEEARQGLKPIWVFGMRQSESWRRARTYTQKRMIWKHAGIPIENYYPILDWNDTQVEQFIKDKGIPENPAWRTGFSFDCLCMAGMSKKKLDRAITLYPDLYRFLAERDKEIQKHRRTQEPAYVMPLLDMKTPLHQYVEKKLREPKITNFILKDLDKDPS
jgi:3'-phosphoadenosine 5'-phosphosulfate sulfotransferase (PAPS reductase)/FAD synthetase